MALNNPQVQFALKITEGQSDEHFLYVTTHFESSDYENNGVKAIPSPEDGTLTVTVMVAKTGTPLRFNKQVYHQVSLDGVNLTEVERFLVVVEDGTSSIASSTIVYQDETETVVKPIYM